MKLEHLEEYTRAIRVLESLPQRTWNDLCNTSYTTLEINEIKDKLTNLVSTMIDDIMKDLEENHKIFIIM